MVSTEIFQAAFFRLVSTPTQTHPHLAVVQPTLNNGSLEPSHRGITVQSYTEKILQNMPVKTLTCEYPTTGLPGSSLVNLPREFSNTFKPQCQEQDAKLQSELWQENG
jgi:hypothetical protein